MIDSFDYCISLAFFTGTGAMRSRARALSRTDEDLEGGQQSSGASPQNGASPTNGKRARRGRKQPPVIRLLKQAFKVKIRRFGRVVGKRNPKKTWRIFAGMGATAVFGFLILNVLLYLKVESMDLADGRFRIGSLSTPVAIKFSFVPATEAFNLPYGDLAELEHEGGEFDFGGLYIDFFEEDDAKRQILHNFTEEDTEYRLPDEEFDDDLDGYYYFDDDKLRSEYINPKKACRRIPEHRVNFQNCNTYHEQELIESGVTFLG